MPEKAKPRKPRPDFPLFPHASGRWAKKIKGKFSYFGKVADDPEGVAAVEKYLDQRDDLQAGRKPRDKNSGPTVRDLCNGFMASKRHLLDTRELSPKTFTGYHATVLLLADHFGRSRAIADLRPEDFDGLRASFAKTRGPVSLGNEIRRTRTVFKWAYDAGLIDAPVRLGPNFKSPGKRIIRQARHAAGPRMFEAADIRRMLDTAGLPLRTMILLGINCGFGQTDCATLPQSALNLASRWLDFPRPKTAVARRVPLWQETRDSLAAAIEARPKAKGRANDSLLFVTRFGMPYVRMKPKATIEVGKPEFTPIDSVSLVFNRLLTDLDLKRKGLGFYALRHTFETVAGEARDQIAVNAIMGHDPGDIPSLYRERIGDDRLRAVVDHVRAWLFG
ncbi:MAG: hypothetical protein H0T47_17815 [Planctomycetaceae bacterium]|nr:hypothetical protein [Planctomycetaceae bacterium]